MKYPDDFVGSGFIPEATGQVINPLAMPKEQADAIFGPEVMEAIRAISEKMKARGIVNKYVQFVPAPSGPKEI